MKFGIIICVQTLVFPDFLLYQAIVKTVTDTSVPGICASCTIFIDSTSDGCAIKLQNDEFTFVFNMFRQSSDELVVLECFSVTEVGEFSVSAYEVQLGEVQEYTSIELPSVTIAKTESETAVIIILLFAVTVTAGLFT